MRYSRASAAVRHAKLISVLAVALSIAPWTVRAQGTLADYRRAATINQRFANLTVGITSGMSWSGRTNQAVYRVSVPGGHRFMKVDADEWTKQLAFDHSAVATGLSTASGQRYTDITLPFTSVVFVENGTAIEGNERGGRYRCTVSGGFCTRVGDAAQEAGSVTENGGAARSGAARSATERCGGGAAQSPSQTAENRGVYSPDCRLVAFVQNYNIAIRPAPASPVSDRGANGGSVTAGSNGTPNYTLLSTDGSEGDAYVQNSIVWSPDSKKLVAYRQLPGYNRQVTFVRSSPTDQLQPKTENTRTLGGFASNYAKPGDVLATNQPSIFDVQTKRQIVIDRALFQNPYAISRPVWRKDNGAYAFHYNQRGHMTYRVLEVVSNTGVVRPMIVEVTERFFM